jgi:hypothetical protein
MLYVLTGIYTTSYRYYLGSIYSAIIAPEKLSISTNDIPKLSRFVSFSSEDEF